MEQALMTINNDISLMVHNPAPGTSAIAIRRAIAQTPVINQLNAIERSVFIASTAKVASEYNDVELVAELGNVLKWIAKDVGVRNTDTNDWKISVVRFAQILKRYYASYSINDVKMAFELMVTGELNEYLPKDRFGNPDKEHYQMFNADYFCKVLNAYKAYRKCVIDKVAEIVPKPVQERPNEKEDAYFLNKAKAQIIAAYMHYKYRGRLPKISPIMEMLAYEELAKVGLAGSVEVTADEQRMILQRTLLELTQTQRIYDRNNVQAQGIRAPEIKFPAYALARRKALERTFAEMVKNEIQIKDYINIESDGKN